MKVLNKKTIYKNNLVGNIIGVLFVGVFIYYVIQGVTETINDEEIYAIWMLAMSPFVIASIFLLFLLLGSFKYYIRVNNGNFIVIKDILKDKEWIRGKNSSHYNLYFEKYFSKYNKYIKMSERYKELNLNDEYYIVFIKGYSPIVYNSEIYEISDEIEEKICSVDDAGEFLGLEEFNVDYEFKRITVTKKQLKNEIFSETIVSLILEFVFLILSFIMFVGVIISKESFLTLFCIGIMTLSLLYFSIEKTKYLKNVLGDIKKDRFVIKEDEVREIDEDYIRFKDKNKKMTIKLKNSQQVLYADRKEFYNTKIGDTFYLIYVESQQTPIKYYNKKNTEIDLE